jgi:hypothetical protein
MLSNGIRWECPGGYLGGNCSPVHTTTNGLSAHTASIVQGPPCLYQATSYCLIAIGSVSKSLSATAPHIGPFPGWLFNPLSYGLFCVVHHMARGPVGPPYEEDI